MTMYENMYGYQNYPNPYLRQQQSILPVVTNAPVMVKSVDNVNEIQANDVPMNYPYAIFPKRDLSEIYVKSWNTNGTIQTLVFAPKVEKVKDDTGDITESKIGANLDATEGILDRFDELSEKLDAINSKLSARTRNNTKKESE